MYRTEILPTGGGLVRSGPEKLGAWLNARLAEGWRLVHVIPGPAAMGAIGVFEAVER